MTDERLSGTSKTMIDILISMYYLDLMFIFRNNNIIITLLDLLVFYNIMSNLIYFRAWQIISNNMVF